MNILKNLDTCITSQTWRVTLRQWIQSACSIPDGEAAAIPTTAIPTFLNW